MKISTKGRYGVRILVDLALNQTDAPRQIHDIAKSQQISEKYISRLVIGLRRARMVRSVRGAKGGVRLAADPKQLTLLEIVEAMEGPTSIVNCVCCPQQCSRSGDCASRRIWEKLNTEIREAMRKITLQDIIDYYRATSDPDGIIDYCI